MSSAVVSYVTRLSSGKDHARKSPSTDSANSSYAFGGSAANALSFLPRGVGTGCCYSSSSKRRCCSQGECCCDVGSSFAERREVPVDVCNAGSEDVLECLRVLVALLPDRSEGGLQGGLLLFELRHGACRVVLAGHDFFGFCAAHVGECVELFLDDTVLLVVLGVCAADRARSFLMVSEQVARFDRGLEPVEVACVLLLERVEPFEVGVHLVKSSSERTCSCSSSRR
jgi:hypothetical protein